MLMPVSLVRLVWTFIQQSTPLHLICSVHKFSCNPYLSRSASRLPARSHGRRRHIQNGNVHNVCGSHACHIMLHALSSQTNDTEAIRNENSDSNATSTSCVRVCRHLLSHTHCNVLFYEIQPKWWLHMFANDYSLFAERLPTILHPK